MLRELADRKDTRNSSIFVKFLDLDKFFPELIFKMPKMVLHRKCEKKEHVSAFEYIEPYNIFLLGIMTPKGCRLEVYAFQGKGSQSVPFA